MPSCLRRRASSSLFAAVLLAACAESTPPTPGPPPAARGAQYSDVLAALDAQVQAARADAARYPESWGELERIAGLHLERAQLSGDYNDYAAAELALEQAAKLAGNTTSVCATTAKLDFALHRLKAAAESLKICEQRFGLSAEARLELDGISADIEFYSGRYAQALAAYRAALAEQETIPGLSRLSLYHSKTGNTAEALALLDRAERSYFGDSARLRAWLKLRRAVIYLESGRWEDALAWLLAAQRELEGWWLIEEHIAEVQSLLGETEAARTIYRDVIERTGHPEYLDALAQLEQDAGQPQAARDLSAKAEAIYRQRLARWPEAAAGHALDHFLAFGADSAETLTLAQANVRNRPYADAQIQLARAYLNAARVADARRLIQQVLRTPWNTAEMHLVAADIHAAAGERATAESERKLALELNPRAEKQFRRQNSIEVRAE